MKINGRLAWYPDEVDDEDYDAEIFHVNTSVDVSNAELYARYLSQVSSNPIVTQRWTEDHRSLPHLVRTALAATKELDVSFTDCLKMRSSSRRFARRNLDIDDISTLLWHSIGLVEQTPSRRRFANPSAGGLYSCSGYCAVLGVDQLDQGIYHYNPVVHCLEHLHIGDVRNQLNSMIFSEGIVELAGAIFFVTIDLSQVLLKYGDRGYRYALIETGHVGQNVALACSALGLSCTPFGGFFDEQLNELLKLASREHVVYALGIGRAAI